CPYLDGLVYGDKEAAAELGYSLSHISKRLDVAEHEKDNSAYNLLIHDEGDDMDDGSDLEVKDNTYTVGSSDESSSESDSSASMINIHPTKLVQTSCITTSRPPGRCISSKSTDKSIPRGRKRVLILSDEDDDMTRN
ncbi:hypothetical protein C0995_001278, partial [Termitomyces sp. Mi166